MNSEPASQPQAPAIGSRSNEASWTAALPGDFGALLRDGIDLHVHGQPDVSRRFGQPRRFPGPPESVSGS